MTETSRDDAGHAARTGAETGNGTPAAIAVAVLLGSLAFLLLFLWDGLYPLVTVPLIGGTLVALLSRSAKSAAAVGAASGFIGSASAALCYHYETFSAYMQHTNPAATADIIAGWWQAFLVPIVAKNPVNDPAIGPYVVVAVGTALTLAVSVGVFLLANAVAKRIQPRVFGFAVIGVLGVCLAWTMFVTDGPFVTFISSEPVARTYGFDAIINLKAYYLMRHGESYYDAIIEAAAGDTRIHDIKNGKWGRDWGIVSPTHIRQPAVFYLWTAVGYFGASGIMWAAVLLAIGLWVVWFWALLPWMGQRGVFVAIALFPLVVVHSGGFNLFHPDWWATLMLMYSAAFLVRKRFYASAAFMLLALLFREVLLFYALAVIAIATWRWLSKRLDVRSLLAFIAALGVFVLAYGAHYLAESPYIVLPADRNTLQVILAFAGSPLSTKFLGPTSYLMFPYGDALVPAFVLAILGGVGLFLGLRGSVLARFALPLYLLVFLTFLATVGASSSYWGQDISPLSLTGCAVLLAGLDRLEWRWRWYTPTRV